MSLGLALGGSRRIQVSPANELVRFPWDLVALLAVSPRLKSGPLVTDPAAAVGAAVARWEPSLAGTRVPPAVDFGDSLPTREVRTPFVDSLRFTDDGMRATAAADQALTGLYVLMGGSMLVGNNGERIIRMSDRLFADTGHTLQIEQHSSGNLLVTFPIADGGYALSTPMDGAPFVVELCAGAAGSRYVTIHDATGVRATQGFTGQAYLGSNFGGLTVGAYNANQSDSQDFRLSAFFASSVVPEAAERISLVTAMRRLIGHPV